MSRKVINRVLRIIIVVSMMPLALLASTPVAFATPNPTSVTIAGSLQSELGCPGDYQPDCVATHLTYDATDDVWQGTWTIPAGTYDYKAALNDSWDENYGANATLNGESISFNLGTSTPVKFYYDHKSNWITSNQNSVIATAGGDFQNELGCSGDWQPDCLRSWLEDPDGDGTFVFETTALPQGSYEAKIAINETWDENYGAGGVPGGANIPFNVPTNNALVQFSYDSVTHVLTIKVGDVTPPDTFIDANPPATTLSRSASFSFSGTDDISDPANLTFECSLDSATFATCVSPQNYDGLGFGGHTFEVRAIDENSNVDGSPTIYNWTILTPSQGLQDLIDAVNGLPSMTWTGKVSLNIPLWMALRILSDGNVRNDVIACYDLNVFMLTVNVQLRIGHLTTAQAQTLIEAATDVKSALGCR